MKRIFSGVQPTGNLHLGNYLGAIRNFARLQNDYECIYCVVDMHSITMWQDPAELHANTREVTAAYLAAGIDPADYFIIVSNRLQCPLCFAVGNFAEELLWKSYFVHIRQCINARQIDTQQGLNNRKAIFFCQRGVPLSDPLHPARDGSIHAVETPVPEIVLGKDIVKIGRHSLIILPRQGQPGYGARYPSSGSTSR